MTSTNGPVSPEKIMQVGLGFWASNTLLSAVELGLFTQLAQEPGTLEELKGRLGLHPRAARDFLDAPSPWGSWSGRRVSTEGTWRYRSPWPILISPGWASIWRR